MKAKLGVMESIARNLVFIDGLARSGKSMFTGIVPSLQRMEHVQFYTLLELIVPAFALGKLEEESAKSILHISLNELAYNILLSRGVNFRYEDQSGILNYREPRLYFERLLRKEGDEVVAELRARNVSFPFETHDLLVNMEHVAKLDLDYKIIEVFRHPVDLVYSWWKKGWGERFGDDPRAFTLTVDCAGRHVPWYCAEFGPEWLAMNSVERCIRVVMDLLERSAAQYKKFQNKERILLVVFEEFAQNPEPELERLYAFLETEPTDYTLSFVHKARCPRIVDLSARIRKLEELKSLARADIVERLKKLSESYERDFYGLRGNAHLGKMPGLIPA